MSEKCSACDGSGAVPNPGAEWYEGPAAWAYCPRCYGTGKYPPKPTPTNGLGVIIARHVEARRHHRAECRCGACVTNGWEACSDAAPCSTCRAERATS